jgi:hypothetical protein
LVDDAPGPTAAGIDDEDVESAQGGRGFGYDALDFSGHIARDRYCIDRIRGCLDTAFVAAVDRHRGTFVTEAGGYGLSESR